MQLTLLHSQIAVRNLVAITFRGSFTKVKKETDTHVCQSLSESIFCFTRIHSKVTASASSKDH